MNFDANGTSGDKGAVWNNGANELAKDSKTPFFVAKGYGSKYLSHSTTNVSYVVEPFITSTQSAGKFTEGTITLSQLAPNTQADKWALPGHTALEIVDGLAGVRVQGFEELMEIFRSDLMLWCMHATSLRSCSLNFDAHTGRDYAACHTRGLE